MTLTDFARSMLRRWYIVIICLALTAAGAFAVGRTVQPAYQSTATVVLLPPPAVVTEEGNPYLFMGGLDQALSVLAVKLNSAEVAQTLVNTGEKYEIAKDPSGPGPLLAITAEAGSGPRSEELRDAILARLPDDLRALQEELAVAEDSQISAMTLVQSDEPERMVKEQLRLMLAAAALGLGLTVMATGAIDRWMLARAGRREPDPDNGGLVIDDEIRDETRGDDTLRAPSGIPPDLVLDPQTPVDFLATGQP